jgi:hypothetical protein
MYSLILKYVDPSDSVLYVTFSELDFAPRHIVLLGVWTKKYEMSGTSSKHGRTKNCIQKFDCETWKGGIGVDVREIKMFVR